jgi:alkylation response protein AidB-like acyl-CoA dehydrogenase
MDLTDSPYHQAFRAEVRAFIATHRHLAPDLFKLSRRSDQVLAWQRLLLEHGYAGRTIPKHYGGFGGKPDLLEARIIADEFTAAGVPMGLGGASVAMLLPTLLAFGSEEQKATWVPPTLRGEVMWCQGYSEPEAGSDLASLTTSAVEDGGDFIINGQKIWTSYAHEADMMFCLVRTERHRAKHESISYLIFSMKTPGIVVRPLKTMTGRPHFNEVFLTDVRVPQSQIVGPRGQGWKVANYTLQHERSMLSDSNQPALRINEIIELLGEESVDGHRLADDPLWRDRLMRLQGRALAMQFNELRHLSATARGEDGGLPRMVSKLQGCELNHQLAALALDALGELGGLYGDSPYLRAEGLWQYRYMFDLGLIIGGGTAQIQKNIIAERGLGLPREQRSNDQRPPAH